MSKMSDMAMTIEELHTAAAAINSAADWLTTQFSGESVTNQPAKKALTPAPKPELALKLEDVRAVLAEKSRAGHTAEIRQLLQKYSANKLSEIEPANYKALLKDAEVLSDAT